jgi:DNA polymerase-3 subunit beta
VNHPAQGLAELKKLVDEEDADEIELGFEGNNGLARKGTVTLTMRLIEGEFPNYPQVIPTERGQQLSCRPRRSRTRCAASHCSRPSAAAR